ncbi:bacteriocin fulvocin C-related protein [Streptomyces sp. NPDC006012]|uniref:bacteriocin fulvocin C-related protein n=1 Tax=Streptomyces sp. NPDC006012 TaxID=3364739 RepID=UPI0036C67EAC
MSDQKARWMLAFDASCGTCRKVASTIESSCRQRLEIVPLDRPDVADWRRTALGENAPWKPTLLKVEGDAARAWTGALMGVALTRRLGVRGTLHVLRALGELTAADRHRDPGGAERGSGALPRKGFLRLAAGGAVAGSLVLAGRTPALAAGTRQNEVRDWMERHKNALPTGYAEVTSHPMAYRRAIYSASAPEVKRSLWLEHFKAYRTSHRALTTDQRDVLDRLTSFVGGTETLFTTTIAAGDSRHEELTPIKTDAIEAFGKEEARALMTQLGPDSGAEALGGECQCALGDPNWCGKVCHSCCYFQNGCATGCGCCCTLVSSGCGSLWEYICDGLCY